MIVGRISVLLARAVALGGRPIDGLGTVLRTSDAQRLVPLAVALGCVAVSELPNRRCGSTVPSARGGTSPTASCSAGRCGRPGGAGGMGRAQASTDRSTSAPRRQDRSPRRARLVDRCARRRARRAHRSGIDRVGAVDDEPDGGRRSVPHRGLRSAARQQPGGVDHRTAVDAVRVVLAAKTSSWRWACSSASPPTVLARLRWAHLELSVFVVVALLGAGIATATPAIDPGFTNRAQAAPVVQPARQVDDLLLQARATPVGRDSTRSSCASARHVGQTQAR